MDLVACRSCHAQFDAEQIASVRFTCRCGATVEKRPVVPHDAAVVRCGSCGASLAPGGESCSFCGSAVARRADQGGPVCPECFARTPTGSRFCTACGVAFRPEPLLANARELPCPACGAALRARAVAGLGVEECASCGGLWIPEGRLESLVEGVRKARAASSDPGETAPPPRVRGGNPLRQRVEYRRCPECGSQMQRRNFQRHSGVILDACRRHGTWLDADELERIAGFVLARGPDADFVAPREERPEPPREERPSTPRPDAADAADAAFARILAEHRAREPRGGGRGPTLLELLLGWLR